VSGMRDPMGESTVDWLFSLRRASSVAFKIMSKFAQFNTLTMPAARQIMRREIVKFDSATGLDPRAGTTYIVEGTSRQYGPVTNAGITK
jgi:hypothetical protein